MRACVPACFLACLCADCAADSSSSAFTLSMSTCATPEGPAPSWPRYVNGMSYTHTHNNKMLSRLLRQRKRLSILPRQTQDSNANLADVFCANTQGTPLDQERLEKMVRRSYETQQLRCVTFFGRVVETHACRVVENAWTAIGGGKKLTRKACLCSFVFWARRVFLCPREAARSRAWGGVAGIRTSRTGRRRRSGSRSSTSRAATTVTTHSTRSCSRYYYCSCVGLRRTLYPLSYLLCGRTQRPWMRTFLVAVSLYGLLCVKETFFHHSVPSTQLATGDKRSTRTPCTGTSATRQLPL